jgi:2-phosphosulfolactate phosphatase
VKLDVAFSAAELELFDMTDATVVVVDLLRATSTIVEALANGALAIYPTGSTEEAMKLAVSLGRDDTLLCGERKGLKIEGYELGNSPREFTAEGVEARRLVMNTTNGTRTFLAAEDARRVLAGSAMNLSRVVSAVDGSEHVIIACAGREGAFALEDALCAGMIIRRLSESDRLEMNDASRAALAMAERFRLDEAWLAGTAAGRALTAIDLGADLALCAQIDRHEVLPEMKERVIRAA